MCSGRTKTSSPPQAKNRAAGEWKKLDRDNAPLRKQTDRLIALTVSSLLIAVLVVVLMFNGLIANYRANTVQESAAHLTEIVRELQLYIESRIDSDWKDAHSIVNSLVSGSFASDEALFAFLVRERSICGVTDVTLYTESGYAVCTDGDVVPNDDASETINRAKRAGGYMTVEESTIVYVVPAETQLQYRSSRIAAVSVSQDLSSFLDNMGISSFDGSAMLYLTQGNGAVVSRLTREGADAVYNILPLLTEGSLRSVSGDADSVEDMFASENFTVFLRGLDSGDQYVVSAPVGSGSDGMRLLYFVPVNAVDRTSASFSRYILTLSIVIIVAFTVGAVIVFMFLFTSRKKRFDKALTVREHMLDLLVRNSKSSFALLKLGQSEPVFRSGNSEKVIGEAFYNLEKTDGVFRMTASTGTESEALKKLNAQLAVWDGNSEFRSAFIRSASPEPTYFEIQLFPVEEGGQAGDYIAIGQDVTPLYERQAAAAEALVMAEQANRAKTRFLSNMSHDIRTPMNAIVNMTNFARESIGDPKRQAEYLDTLAESSAHLLSLINDVLDMSRIESGKVVVACAPFDLAEELSRIADIVRPLCAKKGQTFKTDFTRAGASAVLGDSVKLSQILMNLLSNAVKFTPEGGFVNFTAEEIPSLRESITTVRFTVADNGIGISAKNQQTVFEPFARAENEQVNRIEGTGLGLSICKSYVGAMGGMLRCESAEGRGSVFTVELFFRRTEAAPEARQTPSPAQETPFAGRRCLVCEDNRINRAIAAKLLGGLGFEVETACDGREGADMFLASPEGYYDVIYMDIQMPVMDGYLAAAAIRKGAHPQSAKVPVIAMTANVFAEDIEKARSAGMNGHLGKPILVPELIDTTEKVLDQGGGLS